MSVSLQKIREWVGRYYPAEIIGTLSALAGAFTVQHYSHSLAAAAIAGSITETIGFYSYFAWREGSRYYAQHHAHPRRLLITSYHALRDIIIEFGAAELCDSLFIRPFCMYAGPLLVGNFAAGLIAGKIAADVIFYSFAAIGYELKKRWQRPAPSAKITGAKTD